MAETCPIRRDLDSRGIRPALAVNRAIRAFFYIFFGSLLVSCSGRQLEVQQSFFDPRPPAEWVFMSGKVVTVDSSFSIKEAVAIKNGRFVAVGTDGEMRRWIGSHTTVVNLAGRMMIPGLIDSHIHATVAGLTWNSELHWESVQSLADGLKQIETSAKNKPPGTWIVVGGGWAATQFTEKRLPTRAELDAVAPKHPVYVQYLRQAAVLNSAGLAAAGINSKAADPQGGKFERDPSSGELTGVLQGVPAWEAAYAKIPRPTLDQVRQSFDNCFRELNRLGLTSVADIQTSDVTFAHRRLLADMASRGELSIRLDYYVAPTDPGDELEQLRLATEQVNQLPSSDMFRFAGFAETLVPGTGDMSSNPNGIIIETQTKEKLRKLLRVFAEAGYNFQMRATQDNTARQLLPVIEEVNRETPFARQRIAFVHLEDATAETITRIKKLGGGVLVEDRMVLTGERNVELRGDSKARNAPPLRTLSDSGIPLGAGTDAFRSANYSPMLFLWWLVSGKTVAGSSIRDPKQNLTRPEALRLYTMGSAWFTFAEKRKGSIEVGKLADLAVLNADYLTVAEDQIRSIESVLTMVGGRVVYAVGPFASLPRK